MASRFFMKSAIFGSRHNFGAQGSIRTVALSIVIAVIALFSWAPEAGAYQAYSNNTDGTLCGACHGTFAGGTYTSNKDGTNWGENLHNGHRTTMLAGDCNTCHGGAGTSGREVFLNSSAGGDGLDPIACVGCHGRAEDAAAGGDYGSGLRQQHWVGGITVCSDCHGDSNPANFTPVAENVPPPYYFTPDAAHPAKPTDACDANGSESVFGPTGLDNDGNGQIDGADASCGNTPPVAVDDSYSTTEDTALTIAAPGVLGNDTDADGDALTAVLDTGPASGGLTLNANGSFTYTPAADFNGSDSFTYFANDGTVNSATAATVTIAVNAVNDAPVAADDSYSTTEDTALTIAAPGVLGNDTDADGDALTAVLGTGPANGALTLNTSGAFTYTPNADFNGSDSFTYFANDGTVNSATAATVTITVNAVNDVPVAVNDSYTTAEDTALDVAAPGVLDNDSDADGDVLTAALVPASGPNNGTLSLAANGSFTYTPNANFNGSDGFSYTAGDGTATSNTATVSITVTAVNDAPVAVNDSYTTDEDVALVVAAPGVLANDSDAEGSALTAALVPASGPANGTLTLNLNGSFTYTPNADFNGSDSFDYVANDGTADSAAATVTITVNAVNDAPVAVDDSYSTTEDTALTIAAPGVLGNDTDVDGDPLTAVLNTGPANGVLTLNAGGSFTYTPAAGFNGSDSFTYAANDGTVNSNVATVTIGVNAVNDAPVAVDDSYSTTEDTALTIAAPGVLGNDTDADGDALTAVLGTGPANGALTLNTSGAFTYTPNADFNGSDSFTYFANDGTVNSATAATVTITVNAVNDVPVAVNDSYTTAEDTALVVALPGVLDNDSDADGDVLTAALVPASGPNNGTLSLAANGSFTYTPNANFNGSDGFSYTAGDGTATSNTATVSITVTAVNDAPVAVNDSYTTDEDVALVVAAPGVLANDSDAEGSALTAALVPASGPANGTLTLNLNGSFTYTPNADFNGSDSFDYVANDGTADSAAATVTITVNAVNDAPVAVDDSYSTTEDTALTIAAPGVLGNDTDVDGDPLTAVLNTGPANGVLTLNAGGSFTYTPAAGFNGSDSFTYAANDGTVNSNVATVTIGVNAVNDAPVAVDDSYSTTEDTALTIAAPGVLGNDTDADGDALTAVLGTGPANGALTLNTSGAFTYTPNADFNGSDSFTYFANDGTVNSATAATVTITVNAVNDVPVAVNDSYTTAEDTALVVALPGVLDNDSDADGDVLTAALVPASGPNNGTLSLAANGSFTYTPNANFNGSDGFSYTAGDGTATSNTATVSITVTAVNDAPVAVNDSYTTDEDVALVVAAPGVLANDSDAEGSALTAALVPASGPANGTLTLNLNGSFTYTPNADFNGSDSFDYVANDGTADSAAATVTITVNAVNDAPVAVDDSYSTTEDTALTIAAPGVLGNDTDVDGDPLTAVLNTGPANGVLTLNAGGSFTYTPAAGFNGSDSFTYAANDGTVNSNVATVTIGVNAVNDAPVAVDDSYSTTEDTALTIAAPGVLGNDTDADGDALTAVLGTGPANGALTLNTSGAFTYTPNADFNGSDSFTYFANDGTVNSATAATVTITVNAVNDVPVAVDDAYATDEDTALTIAAPGVLGNDTDVDGDALTAVLNTGPANGVLTLNANGSFTYTPAAGFNGSDSFTYAANDGTVNSNVATVTITVNAVNVPPVANANGPYTGTVGLPVQFDGSASSDSDGTIADYAWTFGDGNSGTGVSPTHTYTAAGTYDVTLTVTDNEGASDTATTTATIDVAPADIDVSPLALEFGPVTVGLTGTLTTSISNLGGSDLVVTGLGLVGSTDFALGASAPTPPFTIAAGDPPVNVPVVYTPGEVGGDSGALDITSDDPDEPVVSVALSGSGVAPVLECDIDVNPLALDFGSVEVGNTATASTSVGNTGTADCTVDSLTLLGSLDFTLGAGAPTLPFIVAAGGPSVDVPVDYTPSDVGDDSGLLSIGSDDVDEPTVDVSLAGTGVAPAILDLDIAGFRVTKRVSLSHLKQVGISLTVKNDGIVNSATRPATVVGMQNGSQVYNVTLEVSDPVGNGRSKFDFPPYTPTASGDITWTATIADDDPDDDTATATTRVIP